MENTSTPSPPTSKSNACAVCVECQITIKLDNKRDTRDGCGTCERARFDFNFDYLSKSSPESRQMNGTCQQSSSGASLCKWIEWVPAWIILCLLLLLIIKMVDTLTVVFKQRAWTRVLSFEEKTNKHEKEGTFNHHCWEWLITEHCSKDCVAKDYTSSSRNRT